MNWEAIGAIGETTGALAVVVSIIYLATQIRGNTRVEKARANFDATHSWAATTDMIFQMPDQVLGSVTDTFRADFDFDSVSEHQLQRLRFLWRAIGQKLEGQYYLFKYGLLEPDIWMKRSSIVKGVIDMPFGASWWQWELESATYSDEFVEAIEGRSGIDVTALGNRPGPQR